MFLLKVFLSPPSQLDIGPLTSDVLGSNLSINTGDGNHRHQRCTVMTPRIKGLWCVCVSQDHNPDCAEQEINLPLFWSTQAQARAPGSFRIAYECSVSGEKLQQRCQICLAGRFRNAHPVVAFPLIHWIPYLESWGRCRPSLRTKVYKWVFNLENTIWLTFKKQDYNSRAS